MTGKADEATGPDGELELHEVQLERRVFVRNLRYEYRLHEETGYRPETPETICANMLAVRDAARDARLRTEWEAKVKALIELIEAEIVSEEPYTTVAYIRGKVSAWRNALVFIRALLADQPEQQPGTEDGGAGKCCVCLTRPAVNGTALCDSCKVKPAGREPRREGATPQGKA